MIGLFGGFGWLIGLAFIRYTDLYSMGVYFRLVMFSIVLVGEWILPQDPADSEVEPSPTAETNT